MLARFTLTLALAIATAVSTAHGQAAPLLQGGAVHYLFPESNRQNKGMFSEIPGAAGVIPQWRDYLEITEINTNSVVFRSREVSADARYSNGVVTAGASLNASWVSRNQQTTVTFLVRATRELETTVRDYKFSEDGKKFIEKNLKNPAAVVDILGTDLVIGERTGGAVLIVYRAECSDAARARAVSAALNGAIKGSQGKVNFDEVVRKIDQRARVDIQATQIGGDPADPVLAKLIANPPQNLDGARQIAAQAFANIKIGVPIRFFTKELHLLPQSLDYPEVRKVWLDLNEKRPALLALREDYLQRLEDLRHEEAIGKVYLEELRGLVNPGPVAQVTNRLALVKAERERLQKVLANFGNIVPALQPWQPMNFGQFFGLHYLQPKGWNHDMDVRWNDAIVLYNNYPLFDVQNRNLIRSIQLFESKGEVVKALLPNALTNADLLGAGNANILAKVHPHTPRLLTAVIKEGHNTNFFRWTKAKRWVQLMDEKTTYTWEVVDIQGNVYRIDHPIAPECVQIEDPRQAGRMIKWPAPPAPVNWDAMPPADYVPYLPPVK